MKRKRFLLIRAGQVLASCCLALGLAASIPAESAETHGIDWQGDLESARLEAKAKNRLLWIQFTGPWCHYCHRMDRESFNHRSVIARAHRSFVPVKLQSDRHEDLVHRFGITGLPATVIIAPDGELTAKHEGFVDGATFDAFLASCSARFAPVLAAARQPAPVDPPAPPAAEPAMGGFSPVSLVREYRLAPGSDAFALVYAGRLYRFADDRECDEFLKQPERYAPVNGGRCPVSEVDRGEFRQGDPHYGVLFGGHLYLCADEPDRNQFLETPHRYTRVNVAERPFCLHCSSRDYLRAHGVATSPAGTIVRRLPLPRPQSLEALRDSDATARR
jgi:thioredoxin-related protein/YHS domain-containing protein